MNKSNIKKPENDVELIKSLGSVSDETIQKKLNEWMSGHNNTLEDEANRLSVFLQAWHASRDIEIKNARAIRDSAIKSGITKKIEKHIRNALQSEVSIPDKTYELLKWGLYGSCAGSPDDKKQIIFNEIMRLDFEHTIKKGKTLSDNKMAEITPYSRKTIRKYRDREDFISSLEWQIEVFQFITKRHD